MDLRGHLLQSAKTALAAGLAWLLVMPLGGIADQYPYYAPLGAVIAVTSTVAGSLRESLQGLAAIAVGAALSLAALTTPLPVVADIALVVGAGSALAGWRGFGGKAAWVPITALFVLIIGEGDALEYALGYLGLVGLGAAVGLGLNLALPPLALTSMGQAVQRLRGLLADQLDDLAEGLLSEEVLTTEQWRQRQRAIRPTTEEVRRVARQVLGDRRANWRARRWTETTERRHQQARALQQVAFLVEDLTALVVDQEHAERRAVAFGPQLRPYAAHALQETAEALRSVEAETAEEDALRSADAAVVRLADEIRAERRRSTSDLFAASTVVAGLRRALATLTPADLRHEVPADW